MFFLQFLNFISRCLVIRRSKPFIYPLPCYRFHKKRVHLVAAGNIIGYSAILVGLNAAWYSQYPRSRFHFFNDNAEWLQVDKAGHTYGAYIESRASNELWRWSGLPRKQRIWISG